MINSIIKFPKGNANFKEIRELGFLYIDKTKYIENIENENLKSILILRPRRFGKSLFINMLACYFDIKESDHFDILFQNTYIHEHPTKNRNAYYVLKFNFSGLTGKHGKELETEFSMKVLDSLRKFISYYDIDIMLLEHNSTARILSRFFVDVEPYLKNRKIYVLIDEYDHFANELLSFAYQEFTSVTNSDGYVRAFYEELKYATETVIAKIFMTGVSPITLDSLTSGFNISTNLSLDSRFNEMLGFTIEEMKYLISMVSSIQDVDAVLADMKQYYDGYMFSVDGKHRIFNPNMALYYLDYWQNFGKQPNEIVDKNILSDYQKLENLLYLPYESDEDVQIQNILDGNHPEVNLTEMFTIHTGLTTDDFYSLLFYLGYLTIDEADALAQSRENAQMHHEDRAGVNAFIRGIDRIANQKLPAAVLMCTNRLKALDPAVQRRAAEILTFSRPNDEQRHYLLHSKLTGLGLNSTAVEELVRLTGPRDPNSPGFTFSDITQRLIPSIILAAYPYNAVSVHSALQVVNKMTPTPAFIDRQ